MLTKPYKTITMSKDNANAAADDLLAVANRARDNKIRAVPWYFRCRELDSLEPRQRLEVLTQAKKRVSRNPTALVSAVLYALIFLVLWQKRNEQIYHEVFQILSFGGPWFIIIWSFILVRLETAKLASEARWK